LINNYNYSNQLIPKLDSIDKILQTNGSSGVNEERKEGKEMDITTVVVSSLFTQNN
jgi:hypothetical protein